MGEVGAGRVGAEESGAGGVGYPYPLAVMRGLWQVDPHPAGCRVTMRFAYQALPTVRGGLFAIALRVMFPVALRRIMDGWQRISVEGPAARGSHSVL